MKQSVLAIGTLTAALLAGGTQASTMFFNNGSGTYTADGVTANVSVTVAVSGHGLHYNGVEKAIGVGSSNFNGAIGYRSGILSFTELETMTVSFDKEVTLEHSFFRQWENNVLGFGDKVYFDYSGGGSGSGTLTFEESGAFGLIDGFMVGLNLTSFTLRPEQDGKKLNGANARTAVYLHSVDFTEVPVPAAAWLFASGLLGLVTVSRRKRGKA